MSLDQLLSVKNVIVRYSSLSCQLQESYLFCKYTTTRKWSNRSRKKKSPVISATVTQYNNNSRCFIRTTPFTQQKPRSHLSALSDPYNEVYITRKWPLWTVKFPEKLHYAENTCKLATRSKTSSPLLFACVCLLEVLFYGGWVKTVARA